jgi:hypothetical protein
LPFCAAVDHSAARALFNFKGEAGWGSFATKLGCPCNVRYSPRTRTLGDTIPSRAPTPPCWKGSLVSEREELTADERDRLVEWGAARTGVTHRGVLVPDRHAAEEDEPVRG